MGQRIVDFWCDMDSVFIEGHTVRWADLGEIELHGDMLIIHHQQAGGKSVYQCGWTHDEYVWLRDMLAVNSDIYQSGYEQIDGIVAAGTIEGEDGVQHTCTVYNNGQTIFDDGQVIYLKEYDMRKREAK